MEVAKKSKANKLKSKTENSGSDKRDLINDFLLDQGRKLSWLSEKTEINPNTLYSILRYKTISLSDENLQKINEALGTTF